MLLSNGDRSGCCAGDDMAVRPQRTYPNLDGTTSAHPGVCRCGTACCAAGEGKQLSLYPLGS